MKTKTVKMVGYLIEGEVSINFWGGGTGIIEMQPFKIFHPELGLEELKTIIPQGLNDNGFGVESFNWADVQMYELYEGGVTEFIDDCEFTAEKVKFGCGFFEEGIEAERTFY